MTWKHYTIISVVLGALAVPGYASPSQNQKEQPAKEEKTKEKESQDPSVWMRMKLEYSQKLLEGVTRGDFELIEQNAERMRGLNRIERFVRGRWEGYAEQLQTFQQANDEIIKQARTSNVEGATLAFTQITISCVTCHKKLREHSNR
jgi:hypothetical protein